MARGLFRKTSFWKTVGAFRSQWKRALLRFFLPGYGKKGMGWLRNPKKAAYNWWYHRTSISIPRMLGYKPSRGACFFALCVASLFSVFALPFDAASSGVKATRIHRARKARSSGSATRSSSTNSRTAGTSKTSVTSNTNSSERTTSRSNSNTPVARTTSPRPTSSSTYHKPSQPKATAIKPKQTPIVIPTKSEEKKESSIAYTPYKPLFERPTVVTPPPTPEPKELDENTPKSTPKSEKDQYIRKRMIIAGSSYCDAAVLAKLQIGSYFDLEAEPDNPYDKDAVKLLFEGEKIGYIAKADRLAFVTCLKLRRNIYGVITNIITENNHTKFEFETWFDSNR